MPEKEPLLTRAKIREMKKQEGKLEKKRQVALQKEFEVTEKKIDEFYTKENQKIKPVKGSRAQTTEKSKERNRFLNKAIVIVLLLLIILFIAIFKL